MQCFLLLALVCAVQYVVAPPVNQKKEGDHSKNEIDTDDEKMQIMYQRYLTEVIQVLESDPEFREKLQKADDMDIRTGKIADELQFMNHNVRSKLDEIKRKELERLRHLATKENELRNGLDIDHLQRPEHVDHTNTRTFEIHDLKKLIAKTTKDLAEIDKLRRDEFKTHEMELKYREQEKLRHMTDAEREKYEQEQKAQKEKHKNHEPVHHPGSRQQLEEVWEKQDHMENVDFDPSLFFYTHDIDGNSVWDQNEVKALFLKELNKLYSQGASEGEMLKREEEMERMREHVFNEVDMNKDGLISYEEFLEESKRPKFQQDEGWQELDEKQIFTEKEFEEFIKLKEHEKMNDQGGVYPPVDHFQHQPQYQDLPQYHQQQPLVPVQQQYPNHGQPQMNHGQMPQQYHPQMQQQQYQPQVPLNQQHQQMQQMHPAQQLHDGSIPLQQQVPVQHQAQIPVQHPQAQIPVQHPQGQIPVQHPQGQIPVQHPQGQIPVQHPQGQIPVQHPQGQVPVLPPQGQIPVQNPQGGGQQASNVQQQQQQQAPVNNQAPLQPAQDNVASQHGQVKPAQNSG